LPPAPVLAPLPPRPATLAPAPRVAAPAATYHNHNEQTFHLSTSGGDEPLEVESVPVNLPSFSNSGNLNLNAASIIIR